MKRKRKLSEFQNNGLEGLSMSEKVEEMVRDVMVAEVEEIVCEVGDVFVREAVSVVEDVVKEVVKEVVREAVMEAEDCLSESEDEKFSQIAHTRRGVSRSCGLPEDAIMIILSYLPVEEVGKCFVISKQWRAGTFAYFRGLKSLDFKSRVMVDGPTLSSFCRLCPEVITIDMDCHRLKDEKDVLSLKSLKALHSLQLTSAHGAGFLNGLRDVAPQLSQFGISSFDNQNEKSLTRQLMLLAERLTRLESFSAELFFRSGNEIVRQTVASSVSHLTRLSFVDVDEVTIVDALRTVGQNLTSFEYKRTFHGASINDDLLQAIGIRCPKLISLKLIDDENPTKTHSDAHCESPIVTFRGLQCLKQTILGQLEQLHLCRSFGLPFSTVSDVQLMQLFLDSSSQMPPLSLKLEELELNGFTELKDGFLHEALQSQATDEEDEEVRTSVPLPCLKHVAFDGSSLSDVGLIALTSTLGPQLEFLSLKHCCQLTENGLRSIGEFCLNLRTCNLGSCAGVNDISVAGIVRNCPKIRTLVLNQSRITSDGLALVATSLPDLMDLALHRCILIDDYGVMELARSCSALRLLSLSGCPVSDEGVVEITKWCPHIQKLRLDETDVTNLSVVAIAKRLRRLRYLHLKRCRVKGTSNVPKFSETTHPFLKCVEMPGVYYHVPEASQSLSEGFRC